MLLRTAVPMPVLEGQRNLTFDSGVAKSFTFDRIEFRHEDIIGGLYIVSAEMQVLPNFGGTPQFTKAITTAYTADGVIGDNGAVSGIASARFDLSSGEMTSVVPRAFLVTVTDSLGRETKYDQGYLLPILVAPAETRVAQVVISPTELLNVALGTMVQMGAAAYDAAKEVLPGSVITYSSSDDLIATVNAIGTVTTVGLGSVIITASSGGKQAHASLVVAADVLMEATFTDADGTDLDGWACDTGQLFTVHSGAAEISGGNAKSTATETAVSVPTGSADGRLQVTLITATPILFRLTDDLNCLVLRPYDPTWELYRRELGVHTLLASGSLSQVSPVVVGITLNGSTIDGDYDGVSLFTGITESFNDTADRVGFLGQVDHEVAHMMMVAP